MVGPPVSTRDRLRHQHVPLISPPDEDIVQQVPLTRPRMPPGGLLSHRQTEEGVRQGEAVFCAGAEEKQAVVVGSAETSLPRDEALLSSRSETHSPSVHRSRSPRDMALLSTYLKRLSTGSTQCLDGPPTPSPRGRPLPSSTRLTGHLKYPGRSLDEGQDCSNRLTSHLHRRQEHTAGLNRIEEEFVTKWGRRLDYIEIPPSPSILQSSLGGDESVTLRPMETQNAGQQGRLERSNGTASSPETQLVLRLPYSLHKRLLASSSKAQATHRVFWQAAGLEETSGGVCLHSVFDWLVQDIVGTCVDGVVTSLEAISDKLIDNLLKHELDSSSVENSEAGELAAAAQTRKCNELLISTPRKCDLPTTSPAAPYVDSRAGTSAATIPEGELELSSREVTPVPFDQELSQGTSSRSSSFSCLAFSLKNDADEIVQEVPEEVCAAESDTAPPPPVQTPPLDSQSRPASVAEEAYLQSSLRSGERHRELFEHSSKESAGMEIEEVNEDLLASVHEEPEMVVQDELSSSAPQQALCVTSTPRQFDLPLEPEEVDVYSADFDGSHSNRSAGSASPSSAVEEINWGSRNSSGTASPLSISIASSGNSPSR
nr:unnamed protein product [Spirometra erinaceieuropaei]